MSEISLALTTRIAPAKKFTVDGEEYQLLGLNHLSDEDENKVMALFARHSILLAQSENTDNLVKGRDLAAKIRETRLSIISTLTDLPKDVAKALPLGQQVKLLETLQEILNDDEEPPAEDASE